MKVKEYEYQKVEYNELSEERKEELRRSAKEFIRDGFIAHHEVLSIGKNDEEYNYLYDYLDSIDVTIRGIDGPTSMEVDMFELQIRNGKSKLYKPYDEEEQDKIIADLLDALKKGDKKAESKCRKALVTTSTRLTKFIAQRYLRNLDIEPDDKEMMGMIGLLNASRKYDPNKGCKFSSYAFPAIYRSIQREYFRENKDKMLSDGKSALIQTIRDLRDYYYVAYGKELSEDDISKILGISISPEYIRTLDMMSELDSKVSYDEEVSRRTCVDRKIDELSDSQIAELFNGDIFVDGVYHEDSDEDAIVVSDDDVMIQEELESKELKIKLEEILDTLTTRESEVLKMRFGLEESGAMDLETVGAHFNVTRERVRQIEAKALRKLRHPSRSNRVKDFWD